MQHVVIMLLQWVPYRLPQYGKNLTLSQYLMKRVQAMTNTTVKGYIFIILSAVLFGCNPLLVTFLNREGLNSISLVVLRNVLSLPFLAVIAFRQNKSLRIPLQAVPSIIRIGLVGSCITPALLSCSYGFIASGTATVFHFIYPAVVVLAGVLIFRERIAISNLVSVGICVLGICLFYTPGEPLDWRGSSLALLSGVTYAIYILQLSHFRFPQISGFLFNLSISAVGGIVMLVFCVLNGKLTLPDSLVEWLACCLFAFVINVCAVVMFQQGTFYIGGQKASILSTLEPITSLVVGAIAFHEVIGFRTAVGSVLVILASILIALTDIKSGK